MLNSTKLKKVSNNLNLLIVSLSQLGEREVLILELTGYIRNIQMELHGMSSEEINSRNVNFCVERKELECSLSTRNPDGGFQGSKLQANHYTSAREMKCAL